ncbi:metallophosphoesterase [Ferruginibacter sp. HRS2-29]|uniref:metallophosphoesterase n=1 Tax=Ferruginibacter sp. HRS2-29 TaxID=2487334 RepID=UPI0020CC34E1|nr:metallophosphoesterase [Ferruginibacter sp. HRS2-29]MCP9752693.1 metallophosphoesterase [Ferruginibacter sp. HRS2-29]
MRKVLQYLLKRPLTWMGNKLAASPKKEVVFKSLTTLYTSSREAKNENIKVMEVACSKDRFIIFSDQHKGNKSWADDFKGSETNYVAALNYYYKQGYSFINLGDSEELWKFKAGEILPANERSFAAESAFQPDRYYKTFGNHDIIWKNKLDVSFLLKKYFQMPLPVHEGIVLKCSHGDISFDIFLTHGHQGDMMSDNNAFSTWIVAHIWMPLQRFLRLNINAPSKDFSLRNNHNKMMHEWSSERTNLILVTGHTHQPVFASGKYYNHPSNKIDVKGPQQDVKPSYFNTGCCCYDDGDITGIEIADGFIRLIKWYDEEVFSKRMVLEEKEIGELLKDLSNG